MPKDETDQHILLKSVVLSFDNRGIFGEQDINEKLKYWIQQISRIKEIDHSSLRRFLVDAGYLTRTKDGSQYQVPPSAPRPQFFEDAVEQIDPAEVLRAAQEEIERRKRAYQERGQENKHA